MFVRDGDGWELTGGAGAASLRARAPVPAATKAALPARRPVLADSRWRTLPVALALGAFAWWLSPPFQPLLSAATPPLADAEWEEARTQSIAPLAFGATSGRRMAAGALVRPLAETPERPEVSLGVTVGAADTLAEVLQRAGVGGEEARRAAAALKQAADPNALAPGTQIQLTLGRRPSKVQPRPLEKLAFRAAFDLHLVLNRVGADAFALDRQRIAIDRAPLRMRGSVGASLLRSARAAGVPLRLVEAYLKALSGRVPIASLRADDTFELVADRARAATGEVEMGELQYAGLVHRGKPLRLVRWGEGDAFVDASGGTVQRRDSMAQPVAGRISSSFGWRVHPLLGYLRMHKGIDIAAPYGTPVYAGLDGVVSFAGWSGGYGRFVKLAHAGVVGSGYGHLSRIAVRAGERVRRGEVIGYVGSTGISTGPHLHWEVWKNGRAVNPRSVAVTSAPALSLGERRAIRTKAERLLATPIG